MIATDRDIELILEQILALSDPSVIYLFGSHARGTATTHSDIDLLIVEPSTLPRAHRGKRIIAALRGFAATFDLLFYTPAELTEELADPLSFASNVASTGRILYGQGPPP